MKKRIVFILILAVTMIAIGSNVSATTKYVYLTTDEYSDASGSIYEYANNPVYYHAQNSSSSAHGVHYYSQYLVGGESYYWTKNSGLLAKGSSVNGSSVQNYNTYWSLQLNPYLIFKNCSASGYIQN